MFFVLSKLLTFLIMPLSWVILSFGLSFIIKKQKLKSLLSILSLSLLIFFTNPFFAGLFMRWWEVPPIPYQELKGEYPLAIVLTGIANLERLPEDRLHFNESVDRINHSIELYKKGIVKRILISGGSGSLLKQQLQEAPRLKEFAVSTGVPSIDVYVEAESRNTYENAKNTKDFLKQKSLEKQKVILVTSAFHMRRASACFNKQEINFIPFTIGYNTRPLDWTPDELIIPSLGALAQWHTLIREWVGMIMYKLAGYI